jgi:hypothetical protein
MTSSSDNDDHRIIVSKTVFLSNSSISCPATTDRVDGGATICHSVNDDTSKSNSTTLKLMMISCEENPPYGPSKDTAVMFLELCVERLRNIAILCSDSRWTTTAA